MVGGRERGRGKLNPKEFAYHSGRIGGEMRLAAKRVPETIAKREGSWSSNAFYGIREGE